MEANLGPNPSYIWQSIIWGKDLMRKGLHWRVGDGRHILVFKDVWIPGLFSGKSSVNHLAGQDYKACDFIQSDGTWNEGLLRNFFPSFEVEEILNIPIHPDAGSDTRYWKWDQRGKYTIKSGYQVEMNTFNPLPHCSSYHLQSWWNVCWNLKIPPKVKIFIWKAVHNYIPTEFNLAYHHVPSSGKFWQVLRFIKDQYFLEIIMCIANTFSVDDLGLFCVISWALWCDVCKRKHDNALMNQPIDVDWATVMLSEFRRFGNFSQPHSRDFNPDMSPSWIKPQIGHLRLDVDAGFNDAKGCYTAGAIIRDGHGTIKAALATKVRNPKSVIGGELTAILLGLKLCLQINLSNIWIYSDSLDAVRAINDASEYFGQEGSLITQIQRILEANCFFGVHHMSRNANNAVHILAKFALSHSKSVWINVGFPSWLQEVVVSDLHA